ncbi:MAG: hypothetical protein ACXAE3_16840 [Candidatus Kariarchaeaceae archaeon]|jgi:NAD kinase
MRGYSVILKIKGICLSSRYPDELEYVSNLIKKLSPETEIYDFEEVLQDIEVLEKCDFIFPIGGDGTVAWLVGIFFQTYDEAALSKLKPIVPVIRPKSVGYLKQIDYDEKKFTEGFKKLMNQDYYNLDRTVISTEIEGKKYLAVNEINVHTAPNLGMFSAYLHTNGNYYNITETMADGVLIATSIGSTGWGLSYHGHISLAEDSLELVFIGGVHSSANFQLPRKPLKITVDLKNSPVADDSIDAYQRARSLLDLPEDTTAQETLQLAYGSRVIVDGKIVAFGVKEIEIKSHLSVPFGILTKETFMDKARRLTKKQDVKEIDE